MFSPHVLDDVRQHLLQAEMCLAHNQLASAIAALHGAIALVPVIPEPHYHLAEALVSSGQIEAAVAEYRLAIDHASKLGRDYCEATLGLGMVLATLGDRAAARAAYATAVAQAERTLGQNCKSAQAHVLLGAALVKACRYGDALKSFQTALRLDPADNRVRSYAAQTLVEMARFPAAAAMCDQVLAVDPNNATARTIKGLAMMGQGRWREGLDYYRWRWASVDFPSPRMLSGKPVWRGEDVHGRTVIVHWEQGHGDVIQYCRFAGMLGQAGARVLFRSKPELIRLLENVSGITHCLDEQSILTDHDFVCPVVNLAQYFLEPDGRIPRMQPYLAPATSDAARWQETLQRLDGMKVGLAWEGNPAHVNDALRSIPLPQFASLAELRQVSLVSLQHDAPPNQDGLRLFQPPPFTDFADTAALIESLDLVISVDTAVAHLAAAMGKPVWLLLASPAEWRWGQAGTVTPWYPSMRLYRQERSGDWKPSLARIHNDLEELVKAGR